MSLYIIGTPIGNLDDITYRALKTLKSVNVVILESYIDSRKLLQHFNINPQKIIKYNARNKTKIISNIINLLKNKDAIFITSAGMPSISDPGVDLVARCREEKISVIPIPGVSAVTTAVTMSGMKFKRFTFIGFLPRQKSKTKKLIETFLLKDSLLIFFESPFRILKSLKNIQEIDKKIEVFIGREMTKKFETYKKGSILQIIEALENNLIVPKGEFTIILQKNI